MMNCEQVTRAAGEHLEHPLRGVPRVAMSLHLMACPGCRAYLEQVRLTRIALHALPAPAPAPVAESLLEAFRAATSAGR